MQEVQFIYNGQRISESDRPVDLSMEEKDEIVCTVIQTGGFIK